MKTGELVDLLVRIEALEKRVRELQQQNVQLKMTQRYSTGSNSHPKYPEPLPEFGFDDPW